MPTPPASDDPRDRMHALVTVCVLALASLVIAFLGASPARVSATELLGAPRVSEEPAFVVSHRGGGALAPENTIPAVTAALDSGFEWVEAGEALIAALRTHGLERRVALASFHPGALLSTSGASPLAFRLLILKRLPRDIAQAVSGADARGVVVDWAAVARRPEVVDELREKGLRVVVYTVNDDVDWADTMAVGVDGIVTDEPVRLREWQDGI